MKRASFRNQILYRILRSGFAAFLISVVLAVLVFYPLLKQGAVRDNKSTNTSSQSEALARWSLNNLNNYNTMVRGVALISENAETIDSIQT